MAAPVVVDVGDGLPFHALAPADALARLGSSEGGLSKAEAAARLKQFGPNVMTPGKSRTLLHMIWDQLANIITVVLVAAAIIAGVFREWIEVGFIIAVVICNAAIGVAQEGKAEAATRAIRNMVSASATTLRNGRKVTTPATDLVPGDIIYLQSGDRIPADVRWLETSRLQVTEAMLTGESTPISKDVQAVREDASLGDRTCLGFTGTLVFTGQGTAVVVATGDKAEIGKINKLMTDVKVAKTPLLVQIEGFGFGLSVLCILIAILTFLIAYLARDIPLQAAFASAISVAVAMIPEGLPTVLTIILSIGVQTMARNKSIIRQMAAVETLGALTCICSDKTGTLTKNEMTAVALHTSDSVYRVGGTGYNPDGDLKKGEDPVEAAVRANLRQLLLPAALCNDATLMPLVSAHAQHMLITQSLSLPEVQLRDPSRASASGEGGGEAAVPAATLPAGLLTQDAGPAMPSAVEALTPVVSDAIAMAMTTAARVVSWGTTGDPTEAALLALAMKSGLNLRTLNVLSQICPRLATLPFSSEHKFMATLHDIAHPVTGQRKRLLLVKGAPDVLLPRCASQAAGGDPWKSEPLQAERWSAANAAFSREGLRVLALCVKELPLPEGGAAAVEGEATIQSDEVLGGAPSLQLNALAAIVDPPREEAIRAVQSCHQAGITVKMITGDHAETARTIGGWIGIETTAVLTGPELERMNDAQLEEAVEDVNIYARASPEHKLRIVRALQKHGHIVAMTGDGVNDAPALRQAQVGVAMGVTGTEVAKEASKMILQDDNFATLEAAVRQGRCTYDNLRKLLAFILPTSVAQGCAIAVAVFLGVPPPLNPIQILYINMITAATLGLVLAAEEAEPGIMSRPPRVQGKPLVGKAITWRALFVGAELIVAMLVQQYWSLSMGHSAKRGTTIAMNTLVIAQCLYCLACRSMTDSVLNWKALVSNPWLTGMVMLNAGLQCLITYAPGVQDVWETEALDGIDWLRILLFAVIIFLMVEAEKKWGPAVVRPIVMPVVRRINTALGCGVRKGPKPYQRHSTAEVAKRLSARELTGAGTPHPTPHAHEALPSSAGVSSLASGSGSTSVTGAGTSAAAAAVQIREATAAT